MTSIRPAARVVALAAAAVLATTTAATADIREGQVPDEAEPADRHAGGTRYATAALTALDSFPDGADTAIIARGDEFPDGLAASYLAGLEDAPILLTKPSELPLETQDAMADNALGTQRAVIVGGPAAIDASVEERLEELLGPDNVRRVSGQSRFETAAIVFNEGGAGTLRDVSGDSDRRLRTAIVASGRNFPDALAAGPLAHAAGVPILLTERTDLPGITRIALESDVQQVIVAGGPVAVSDAVVSEIEGIDGIQVVERVSGGDRTATAAAFAELTRDQLGWDATAASLSGG